MTDIFVDVAASATAEDVDFSLDDNLPAEDVGGEDFDFDIAGGDSDEGGKLDVEDGGATSTLSNIEIAADVDEISYEDDVATDHLRIGDATDYSKAVDEIDYEDGDPQVATVDFDDVVANAHDDSEVYDAEAAAAHDKNIDFRFEETRDAGGDEVHDFLDHEAYEDDEVNEGSVQHMEHVGDEDEDEEGEGVENDDDEEEEDEEEEEEGDDDENQEPVEADRDDSDGTGQDYDDDDDDIMVENPSESLHPDLAKFRGPFMSSTKEVIVTWGEQVCPLFKKPGVEDPDSFYLDNYEAVDYPLSKFLSTIRRSISSWLHKNDEIYIRIDDLGFEFGETTTDAMLARVTFHHLLALHDRLVKNDSPASEKSLHIVLATRANPLLRLKDLATAASVGRGLSSFLPGHEVVDVDDSSDESVEIEAESIESSPDDDEDDDMAEEDEGGAGVSDVEAVDTNIAVSVDDDSVAGESARIASGDEDAEISVQGATLETPTADDDDEIAAGSLDEVDFTEFADEKEEEEEVDDDDDDKDQVEGVLLGPNGVSHLATPQADAGDDLLQDIDGNAEDGEHNDEMDLLEELNDDGDIIGHNQDEQEGANLEPENGIAAVGEGVQRGDDDDFLDLHGDIEDGAQPAEAQEPTLKAAATEPGASLDTSATATVDYDEIDYEDSHPVAPKTEATEPGGVDEIDWDEEIKTTAPADATSTPTTASGKRTREVDEEEEGLLEDLPDQKRHRTGETPA